MVAHKRRPVKTGRLFVFRFRPFFVCVGTVDVSHLLGTLQDAAHKVEGETGEEGVGRN